MYKGGPIHACEWAQFDFIGLNRLLSLIFFASIQQTVRLQRVKPLS